MVFKEIILIKVTLRISKNLRKGDNNEEISKFKMQITADEMQKIKDFIYDEYSSEKVKLVNKLKREFR